MALEVLSQFLNSKTGGDYPIQTLNFIAEIKI
jgi:hypothetical protein